MELAAQMIPHIMSMGITYSVLLPVRKLDSLALSEPRSDTKFRQFCNYAVGKQYGRKK